MAGMQTIQSVGGRDEAYKKCRYYALPRFIQTQLEDYSGYSNEREGEFLGAQFGGLNIVNIDYWCSGDCSGDYPVNAEPVLSTLEDHWLAVYTTKLQLSWLKCLSLRVNVA